MSETAKGPVGSLPMVSSYPRIIGMPFHKGRLRTMEMQEVQKAREVVNDIDWDMTPEEAVTLYLEWGNNWSHGKRFVRSKHDVTHYFVVNTWEENPKVYLVRRNSDAATEMASLDMPEDLSRRFLDHVGHRKGVYAITREIRTWLEDLLSSG